MTFFEALIAYADTYGSIIPLVVLSIVFHKRKVPKTLLPLVFYLFISVIVFGFSNYLADRKINNLFLYNIFSAIELALILYFFHGIIKNPKIRKWILPVILLYLILLTGNLIFLEKINSFNSNALAIEFLFLIIFCFSYYYELSSSEEVIVFLKTPYFWMVSGFFIYFSTCILVFVLYKYAAIQNRKFILDFWEFQVIMYLIKNILIAKGLLCFKTPT